MKNIYEMLNDIEIDLSEYEKEDFNDIEKQRIKNKFRKSINSKKIKKNNNYNKYVVVASAACISLFVFSKTEIGSYANEAVTEIVYGIKEALGIKVDLTSYATNVNQSITKKGLTVKINDVILDGDELLIHITKTYDEKLGKDGSINLSSEKLSINGKTVSKGSSGYFTKINENTEELIIGYKLEDEDYNGDINVRLRIGDAYIGENPGNYKHIYGPWIFKFKVNSDKLKNETKEISTNDSVKLKDGTIVTIDKYISNVLREEIHVNVNSYNATSNEDDSRTYSDLILKGKDNLGNEVLFRLADGIHHIENEKNYSVIYEIQSDYKINDKVKEFYLTPYLPKYKDKNGEGKIIEEKIGEEFTLNISEK